MHAGVKTFQKWIRQYAGGPPMSDPFAKISLESLAEPNLGSLWERHGQHCPRCNRVLKHVDRISRGADQASKLVLAASAIWTMVASLSKKTTPLGVPLVVGVFLSLLLKAVKERGRGMVEELHRPLDGVNLVDVYQY